MNMQPHKAHTKPIQACMQPHARANGLRECRVRFEHAATQGISEARPSTHAVTGVADAAWLRNEDLEMNMWSRKAYTRQNKTYMQPQGAHVQPSSSDANVDLDV